MALELIPSILCPDEASAHKNIDAVKDLVDYIQIDVLDNTLYPNQTWADPEVVTSWNLPCSIELDLMVADPKSVADAWKHVPTFKRAIWHIEAPVNHAELITYVQNLGREASLSIAPGTPFEKLEPFLGSITRVLVLGVKPGFSGQALLQETLSTVRALAKHPTLPLIAFDGGITEDNITELISAGVQAICPNSLIFKHPPVDQRIQEIRDKLTKIKR